MTILYLFLSIVPFILPESFIEWMILQGQNIQNFLKYLSKRTLIAQGQELVLKLSSFYGGIVLEEDKRHEWPEYKFFTSLALELRRLARTFGAPLEDAWKELKFGLNKDILLQRDVGREIAAACVQFFLITLITWIFIWFSSEVVGKMDSMRLAVIITIQIIGALIFFIFTGLYKKYYFKCFDYYFTVIYRLDGLIEANLSMAECIELSGYGKKDGKKNFKVSKNFRSFEKRIETTIHRWRNQGHSPSEDLKLCCQTLWELYERALARYKSFIVACRFLVLALFYLGSYFFFIINLALKSVDL